MEVLVGAIGIVCHMASEALPNPFRVSNWETTLLSIFVFIVQLPVSSKLCVVQYVTFVSFGKMEIFRQNLINFIH